ncbi:MAG: hypothetical protein RL059_736 [Bacteroidota bacterium]|jgi:hypothetical protein
MSLIGTIAATSSAVFNLDFLPEHLLIGTTSADTQSLSSLSVVCSGVQLMSVTSAARLTALAKFDSGAILSEVALEVTTASYLKLAAGRINKATTITGTNGTAAVKNVFAASSNITNVARRAVEQSINASANATFDNFEALFFSGANILRAQITFDNGFTDEYTTQELLALYAGYHIADADGALEGQICIDSDSGAGKIAQVVLFSSSGGATVVLKSDYVVL